MSLRPVGDPVPVAIQEISPPEWCQGYRALYLRSGTEALALALCMIRSATDVPNPAVILPAYGCPDLVSAACFARLRVVFADVGEDSSFMDPSALEALITDDVIAIVAVHFLGIPDDLRAINRVCQDRGVIVVEDSAQLFPEARKAVPTENLVVLSFGRGKPVSALGGGALLYKKSWLPDTCSALRKPVLQNEVLSHLKLTVGRLAYNILIQENPYSLLRRIPKTGLGETRYRRTKAIAGAGPAQCRQIWTAIDRRQSKISTAQNAIYEGLMRGIGDVIDLAGPLATRARLLRYPVLLPDQKTRNEIFMLLDRSGLGPSVMYGVPLPAVQGVANVLTGDHVIGFPRATKFAGRLLTLPIHSGVKLSHVELMLDIIRKEFN